MAIEEGRCSGDEYLPWWIAATDNERPCDCYPFKAIGPRFTVTVAAAANVNPQRASEW